MNMARERLSNKLFSLQIAETISDEFIFIINGRIFTTPPKFTISEVSYYISTINLYAFSSKIFN